MIKLLIIASISLVLHAGEHRSLSAQASKPKPASRSNAVSATPTRPSKFDVIGRLKEILPVAAAPKLAPTERCMVKELGPVVSPYFVKTEMVRTVAPSTSLFDIAYRLPKNQQFQELGDHGKVLATIHLTGAWQKCHKK